MSSLSLSPWLSFFFLSLTTFLCFFAWKQCDSSPRSPSPFRKHFHASLSSKVIGAWRRDRPFKFFVFWHRCHAFFGLGHVRGHECRICCCPVWQKQLRRRRRRRQNEREKHVSVFVFWVSQSVCLDSSSIGTQSLLLSTCFVISNDNITNNNNNSSGDNNNNNSSSNENKLSLWLSIISVWPFFDSDRRQRRRQIEKCFKFCGPCRLPELRGSIKLKKWIN